MASTLEDDSVSITFPSGDSMLSDPSLVIDQVDRLLFSEDAYRFQEMGVVATRKNCFRETYQVFVWNPWFALLLIFWYVDLTFYFLARLWRLKSG